MAVTVGTTIDRVRRELLGMRRSEINLLSSSIVAGDTTLAFSDQLGGITKGAYLGIESEIIYVRSTTGTEATVLRGMLGTTAVSHASGTIVEVSPRWARADVKDALRDEILSWRQQLYRVSTTTLSVTSDYVRGYDLAGLGTFYDVLEVSHQPYDTTTKAWSRVRNFRVDRGAPTSDFASGISLTVNESMYQPTTLALTYSRPFDLSSFAESTDLIATVGLEESFVDIARYGAGWRLMAAQEVIRTDLGAQGEPRVREEVPPGHRQSAAVNLKRLRDDRLGEEIGRLIRRWGTH